MDPTIQGLRPALHERARALGLPLDETTADQLLRHLDMLQRWNSVYNLTAVRAPVQMLSQHLLDCLAVVPALRRELARLGVEHDAALLDVGSGGGLPGVVLAILQPHAQVICVDTVAKKAGFVRQVAAELPLPNLQAAHSRVEALVPARAYDVITARAFASLADFVTLTRRLLAPTGVWMAMKGQVPDEEMANLPQDVEVFHVEQLAVPGLDAQRCLVWMRMRTSP